jgi:hypothetical protein
VDVGIDQAGEHVQTRRVHDLRAARHAQLGADLGDRPILEEQIDDLVPAVPRIDQATAPHQ